MNDQLPPPEVVSAIQLAIDTRNKIRMIDLYRMAVQYGWKAAAELLEEAMEAQ